MARKQSKKRHLLRFAKTSNSMSGLASSPGRSEAQAGNCSSIPETSGIISPGRLARMRRFFHRSNQGPSTTITPETTDIQAGGGVQEQQQHSQAAPDQDAAATSTGEAQEQQKQPHAVSTKDAGKSVAKPEPTPASAGKDIGVVDPISCVAKGAVDVVSTVNTTFSETQTLSDTYLKPFKVFNQVVSTLGIVHPYAQAALGILTCASKLFLNQANLDKAVSGLLGTMRSVYKCLVKQDRISNLDRVALGKIARAISDSAHFIINYSTTKSFCTIHC
ncbi:hypothetical protein EDD16DRAFT_1520919 [Pisolithus croceorrhizus]|nr:hypothetical protein EDD16DRAFT_1520919 [Pisolithus croceorrhizus]